MNTRRLTFAVGTSLLTASLATGTVGCKKATSPEPEGPHVNEGPTDQPTEIVNTVPEDEEEEAPDEEASEDED